MTAPVRGGRRLGALLLVLALAWFGGLELRGLFVPDEGRYAEIPREMLATGDWVTPRLNDLKYFEKPPLQYWATATAFAVFGEAGWTARLPAAVAGFLGALLVMFTARRLWGPDAGIAAGIVVASSWGYFLGGQFLTLDMSLTFWLTIVLCAFLISRRTDATQPRRRWLLLAWAAAALAVLTKGLIGIVLPTLALIAYTVIQRDRSVWRDLELGRGMAVFGLVALPWFILVQWRNPEFFDFFIVREHFQRFAAASHHRPGPWWYFVPILFAGLLPWTPAVIAAALRRCPAAGDSGFPAERFCLVWAMVILVFFSLSQSKLPAYILPALPALALLTGARLARFDLAPLRWSAWTVLLLGAAATAFVPRLPQWSRYVELGAPPVAPWLVAAAASLCGSGLLALWFVRRRQAGAALVTMALSTFVVWQLVFVFLHVDDRQFSSRRLVESITERGRARPFAPQAPFFSVGLFDQTVPFYLGRPVTLVEERNEVGTGIDAEPDKWVPSLDAFGARWRELAVPAFAVMSPATFARLGGLGLPMHEIGRDPRLVVVERRAGDRARALPGPVP